MKRFEAICLFIVFSCVCWTEGEDVTELKVEVLKEGDCLRRVEPFDTLRIHFVGYLTNGTKFTTSYDHMKPHLVTLGESNIIKGLHEGLLNMCEGETRKLTIPYQLAYGERGVEGQVPRKATVVFKVQLINIQNRNPHYTS